MELEFHATSAVKCPKNTGKKEAYSATRSQYNAKDGTDEIYQMNFDKNNQKVSQSRSTYKEGKIVKEEFDFDLDNLADSVDYYSHDSEGNLTDWYMDYNNDGNIDAHEKYAYDNRRNLTHWGIDNNADNVLDSVRYIEYDADNNMVRDSFDKDNDGMMDSVTAMEYENGQRSAKWVDKDNDGLYDEEYHYGYDDIGNLTSIDYTAYDNQNNSNWGYIDVLDGNGNTLARNFK